MTLDTALRRAIRQAPCSIRALAREAGVSFQLLSAVHTGRERATPRVTALVAAALERMGAGCAKDAATLRAALAGQHRKGEA